MSSGQRLVTRPLSTTTSSLTTLAPAFLRSVRMLSNAVRVRPSTTPASISSQGAWQMAATGLPASKKARTNATASLSARSWSGLATPPGSSKPA